MRLVLRPERRQIRGQIDCFLRLLENVFDCQSQIGMVLSGNDLTAPVSFSILALVDYLRHLAVPNAHAKRTAPRRRTEALFVKHYLVTADPALLPFRAVQLKLMLFFRFVTAP